MNVLPACVYYMCAWCWGKSEEGAGYPRTEGMDGCEQPCEYWELNLDLLQKQHMLLIPYLQPLRNKLPKPVMAIEKTVSVKWSHCEGFISKWNIGGRVV